MAPPAARASNSAHSNIIDVNANNTANVIGESVSVNQRINNRRPLESEPFDTDLVQGTQTQEHHRAKRRKLGKEQSAGNVAVAVYGSGQGFDDNHIQYENQKQVQINGHLGTTTSQRDSNTATASSSSEVSSDTKKMAPLKGRKRFNADFEEIKTDVKKGLVIQGLRVSKFRAGDDEGCIVLTVSDGQGKAILTVNLLVSETSDYPDSHSIFSYSDETLSTPLQDVIESVASGSPKPLQETIQKFVASVAKVVNKKVQAFSQNRVGSDSDAMDVDDDEEDEDDEDDYEAFALSDVEEDDFGLKKASGLARISFERLQRDFIDIVATGYRPGFLQFTGATDFSISISLPIVALTSFIPPRALMAWDRRLLTRRNAHLTLLISGTRGVYPFVDSQGRILPEAASLGANLNFQVGLTKGYKPSVEQAMAAGRTFGLIVDDAEDEFEKQRQKEMQEALWNEMNSDDPDFLAEYEEQLLQQEGQTKVGQDWGEEPVGDDGDDEGRLDKFSLSSSLESLMDGAFVKVLGLRREFGLGWAGAEVVLHEMEKMQVKAEAIIHNGSAEILAADKEEAELMRTNSLPHDPLQGLSKGADINFPLTAFCYLVRRLMLCTRHCIVCHNKLTTNYDALKPYVCESKLCTYQYYSLNRGTSLEYEIIHNPGTVDLLVSIAYSSAIEGAMNDPLPIGMGLRVPQLINGQTVPQYPTAPLVPPGFTGGLIQVQNVMRQLIWVDPNAGNVQTPGADGLVDFDSLPLNEMQSAVVQMIDSIPPVDQMRKHLLKKVKLGKSKPKLRDVDPSVLPAAWLILRWCVASCTAYLEEITKPGERIANLDKGWRQFRFAVGAPDAEAKFKSSAMEAQKLNTKAIQFPSIYAFHGSPLKNWHSIIRHGLWYKTIAHGRAYGNGVYLAKEGSVSSGGYAAAGRAWRRSRLAPTVCMALAEIVNLPGQFVSNNPYYVVQHTHWIMCRYLLVKGIQPYDDDDIPLADLLNPYVPLDPQWGTTFNNKPIQVPDPSYKISKLLEERQAEYAYAENDEADAKVFEWTPPPPPPPPPPQTQVQQSQSQPYGNGHLRSNKGKQVTNTDNDDDDYYDDDNDYQLPPSYFTKRQQQQQVSSSRPAASSARRATVKGDWQHDVDWVSQHVERLLPPPHEASPVATMAIQRELKYMLKEQAAAKSLKELGWYMPEEFIGDNLFQWIVEMHSFEEGLDVQKDMKKKKVNSLIFEIRFPPTFPNSPPFFRILSPRFLPFIHGGGGHITGGGSICMDLLTADGWLPTYSISAVLLQIKLAISSTDPRPARLASNWDLPYSPSEALEGYIRAAATHNWRVPQGLDRLVR